MVNISTNNPDSQTAHSLLASHPLTMLAEIYIEALLVDEDLADQVWELWDAGVVDDHIASLAWWMIAAGQALLSTQELSFGLTVGDSARTRLERSLAETQSGLDAHYD